MTRAPLARLGVAAVALCVAIGTAVVARQAAPAAPPMADAARAFLATLEADQRANAAFAFADPAREKWYFTPQQENGRPTRKGLRLDQMTPRQKTAALELLRTGLSTTGFEQAGTIMSLESVLADLEKNGANVRNPEWYFVSIFGQPTATGEWGWRIEGHHLSVNVTLKNGQVVSATPVLFASNPAEVRNGPRKGLRTLPDVADRAQALIASLTAEQDARAKQMQPFPEIQEGQPDAGVGAPVGLPAAALTAEQKPLLEVLVAAYADRLTPELAAAEKKRVAEAGPDAVHFAYSRADDLPGNPVTYRIQGPTFVAEFLNVQADSAGNPANHIHSGWRRLPADFGLANGK